MLSDLPSAPMISTTPARTPAIGLLQLRRQFRQHARAHLQQVFLRLERRSVRSEEVDESRHVVLPELHHRERHRSPHHFRRLRGGRGLDGWRFGGVADSGEPLRRRPAHERILVRDPGLEERRARRVRDPGKRVERRPGSFAFAVELQLLHQRLHRALVANFSEGSHGREADRRARIVDRLDQRVASALDVETPGNPRRCGTDRRIVVIERLDQPLGGAVGQRRPRHGAERIDGLDSDARILVVDRLEERVDDLRRHGPRPGRQRPLLEGLGRLPLAAHFDHEPHPLPKRHVLDEEERQLGGNRLELNLVERIVDDRGDRNGRGRVLRLAQHANGAQARLRVGIPQIADDVLEPGLARVGRHRQTGQQEGRQQEPEPLAS